MKEKIMSSAERQLIKGGYHLLNFATIAEELSITRANIHYHFKNKETLALEVVKQYGIVKNGAFRRMKNDYKGDFFTFMQMVDESLWAEMSDQDDGGVGFFALLALDPEVPQSVVDMTQHIYEEVDRIIEEAIQDAIDHEEVRPDVDVKREAMRAHVLMIGMSTCGETFISYGHSKNQLKGLILDWAYSLR